MRENVKCLKKINWTNTRHDLVSKKVFYTGDFFESNITQIAYSELQAGQIIDPHSHNSMDEVFFLINGICEFIIDDKCYTARAQSVISIPAKHIHSLRAISLCKFYYFGVEI